MLFLSDYTKVCDSRDSNKEGEEYKEYYNILMADLELQYIHNECNKMDGKEVGLSGAPSGWIQPGLPDDFIGYKPKHNAPKREDINNVTIVPAQICETNLPGPFHSMQCTGCSKGLEW